MKADLRLLAALLRSDFESFARAAFQVFAPGEVLDWNWHLEAICYHLELVRTRKIKRLIIEAPPRSLKSFIASVAFPAYCLGRDPRSKIITASYSLDLAIKLANDFRALMRSSRYRSLFPGVCGSVKDTETEFTTAQQGYRYSTSSGGTLTGRGADLMILDEPMRSDDASSAAKRSALQDWYRNTLFTRLNSKKDGAIVLVMQRLHIDDLAGYLRQQGGWTILSLPAIAVDPQRILIGEDRWHDRKAGALLHPVREPQHILSDIRETLGSYHFSAQYQQQPVPIEGELVKWSWFKPFEVLPHGERRIVQSWDVAVKAEEINDYSVCTTWAIVRDEYYLLDLHRERLTFPDLVKQVISLARKWRTDSLVIEDKASGSALIQQLGEGRIVGVPRPIAYTPKLDKVSRLSAESATIEAGRVHIQAGATWHADLRSELAQFPNGRFDDQVDSISQFLLWVRSHRTPSFQLARTR